MVLSSSLPNIGSGGLKNREDPKILGTSKESGLLQSASPFYKTFAIECSRAQVSVDMFLFSASYQDVASLGRLDKCYEIICCSCISLPSLPPPLYIRPNILLPGIQRCTVGRCSEIRPRIWGSVGYAYHVGSCYARSGFQRSGCASISRLCF